MEQFNVQPNWYPPAPHRRRRFWGRPFKFLGLFAFFFVLLTLIVMGPTIYTKIAYYFTAPSTDYSQKYELPVSVTDDLQAIQDVTSAIDQKISVPSQDTILIPKINVTAPLVYPDQRDNAAILEAIKEGVAHYPNTALPGRVGNVFLTGHSSYYWWSGGKYNQVFALLDKLATGDLIYVYYQGGRYSYRVSRAFVVNPDQVDVLNASDKPILTLMTCTPVGTNLRRLIIQADLIGRPPVDASAFTPFQQIPTLPNILPV